jgi:hypothetical protein
MRWWRPWMIGLPLMTGALIFDVVDSHLSAQAPPLEGSKVSGSTLYEAMPKLFAGPNGETLRMWYRSTTPGTGGTILAAATASGWQSLVEIMPTEKDTTAGIPDLAIGPSGQMVVAYQWWRKLPTSSKQIRVAQSSDGGKTWAQPAAAVDMSGKAFTPKAAWGSDGSLVVAWADEQRSNRVWDVYARRSSDGGATWESEQLLSRFPQHTPTDAYVRPELISDGDKRFWAIWTGIRSSRSRVYFNRSTDGGRTWTDPLELSRPQSDSVFNNRIVRAGEHLLVVWQDKGTGHERLYAVTSSDGGATWSAPGQIAHLPDDLQTDAFAMTLTMSPEREVLVVWNDGRNGRDDIFVGHSADGGRTWDDKDVRLDMDEAGTAVSRFPSIARAANGRIAVAWEDDRAGYEGVYVRIRSAGPEPRWGSEILVEGPNQKKGARQPAVMWAADGSLYVAWEVWDYTAGPLGATRRIDSRRLVLDKP